MIRFSCPKCDTVLEVAGSKAGTITKCPECNQRMQVPDEEEDHGKSSKSSSSRYQEDRPVGGGKRSQKVKPAAGPRRKQAEEDDDEDGDEEVVEKSRSGSGLLLVFGGGLLVLALAGVALAVVLNKKDDTAVANNGGNTGHTGGSSVPIPQGPTGKQHPGDPGGTPPDGGDPGNTIPGSPGNIGKDRPLTGDEVYKRLLKSTVWVVLPMRDGYVSGTGSLVDRKNRLILTNYHVVSNNEKAVIFFPRYRGGELVASRDEFVQELKDSMEGNGKANLLQGTVVARDMRRDMALVQLPKVPDGVLAIRPATISPTPGQEVHSLGNPGASGGLWCYTKGSVKQVYHKTWQAGGKGIGILDLEAKVIETQSPTNPGDSGGPLVNDRAELVGITQGGSREANSISFFIDISEGRDFIESYLKRDNLKWEMETEDPLPGTGTVSTGDLLPLIKGLDHRDATVRARSAGELGAVGPKAQMAVPFLVKHVADQDALVRRAVQEALNKIGKPGKDDARELTNLLKDPAPEVRARAAEALAQLGPDAQPAVHLLLDMAREGQEATTRRPALIAVGRAGAADRDEVFPVLLSGFKDTDREVRAAAAEGLTALGATAADVPALADLLADKNAEVRLGVASTLGHLGPPAKAAVPKLIAAMEHSHLPTRIAAVETLGKIGPEARAAAPKLLEMLKNDDEALSRAAATSLGELSPLAKAEQDALNKLVDDPKPSVRCAALLVLAKSVQETREASIPVFAEALKDKDKNVRVQAVTALVTFAPTNKDVISRLLLALKDTENDVRKPALVALALYGAAAKDAVPTLRGILRERKDREFLAQVVVTLGGIGPDARAAAPDVAALLDDRDTDKDLTNKIFTTLAKMGAGAASSLLPALNHVNKDYRTGAANALAEIGPPVLNNRAVVLAIQLHAQADADSDAKEACVKAARKIGIPIQ